ncbi:MAG: LytR/AlgR family response regulator transcription factor [Ekhidna sp.]
MYKCLVIDDEDLARELIVSHLEKLEDFQLSASCSSALEASSILQREKIDLIFLDIEMPVLKGTDFLKGLNNPPKIIFTTAYRDYALEGFELSAIDYLLKPIVFERFFQAIQKFTDIHQSNQVATTEKTKHHIYVSSNKKKIKVLLEEVYYVESIKDYIKIHLVQEKLIIKRGITSFYEELDNRFLRVHRSFIVNKEKITSYTKSDIELGSIEIPIGESYKDEFMRNIE